MSQETFSEKIIRVSYGTSIELGLKSALNMVPPTTAYLLHDRGCEGGCSFCPRSGGMKEESRLARVSWPEYKLSSVISGIQNSSANIKRICLQTTFNKAVESEVASISESLSSLKKPLCVTLHPSQTDFIPDLFNSGAEKVGIGLDAATENVYSIHKASCWKSDFPKVLEAIRKYPKRIGVHLIFGLGNSEEEFAKLINFLHESGCSAIALFAFTPIAGKETSGAARPPISSYRRIQTFRYLNSKRLINIDQIKFINGQIVSFGVSNSILEKELSDGEAFRTSGCNDCNRPFYNESPRGPIYNYPAKLSHPEVVTAFSELFNDPITANKIQIETQTAFS
ncbi:MAG: radical SAM protein [Candidatus Riflebacteria bacterium]|nr:radical SAM protein [Candidatus Riflebacteria bacterium]